MLKQEHINGASHWSSSCRFGDGYTIILRLADNKSNPDSCPVCTYMTKAFPCIELKERHENVLQYQLPSHVCCLARVFDMLANNYEELGILDFSVSQTTLDQVRNIPDICNAVFSSGIFTLIRLSLTPRGSWVSKM